MAPAFSPVSLRSSAWWTWIPKIISFFPLNQLKLSRGQQDTLDMNGKRGSRSAVSVSGPTALHSVKGISDTINSVNFIIYRGTKSASKIGPFLMKLLGCTRLAVIYKLVP